MTIQEAINHTKEVAERNRKCNKNKECIDITCEKCAEEHEQLAEWLEELQQYRAIGTVEECREARERQMAKKPVYPYLKSIPTCSNCGEVNLQHENEYGNVDANYDFCPDCGQAIDWSDTD